VFFPTIRRVAQFNSRRIFDERLAPNLNEGFVFVHCPTQDPYATQELTDEKGLGVYLLAHENNFNFGRFVNGFGVIVLPQTKNRARSERTFLRMSSRADCISFAVSIHRGLSPGSNRNKSNERSTKPSAPANLAGEAQASFSETGSRCSKLHTRRTVESHRRWASLMI
jgi:hypothetical protein